MIDAFAARATLTPYIEPATSDLDDESPPVATPRVESTAPTSLVRLRAFLSYRFGTPDTESAAETIRRFLDLLNVEVVTGRGYEPRALHEKVGDRLVGLDLAVVLVGTDGESLWTRDEIATARSAGAFVIPIVATGATFALGLFGDLEYIPFAPGHIGDALISLLEGVAYIRRIR
jgi:hypothetical protein